MKQNTHWIVGLDAVGRIKTQLLKYIKDKKTNRFKQNESQSQRGDKWDRAKNIQRSPKLKAKTSIRGKPHEGLSDRKDRSYEKQESGSMPKGYYLDKNGKIIKVPVLQQYLERKSQYSFHIEDSPKFARPKNQAKPKSQLPFLLDNLMLSPKSSAKPTNNQQIQPLNKSKVQQVHSKQLIESIIKMGQDEAKKKTQEDSTRKNFETKYPLISSFFEPDAQPIKPTSGFSTEFKTTKTEELKKEQTKNVQGQRKEDKKPSFLQIMKLFGGAQFQQKKIPPTSAPIVNNLSDNRWIKENKMETKNTQKSQQKTPIIRIAQPTIQIKPQVENNAKYYKTKPDKTKQIAESIFHLSSKFQTRNQQSRVQNHSISSPLRKSYVQQQSQNQELKQKYDLLNRRLDNLKYKVLKETEDRQQRQRERLNSPYFSEREAAVLYSIYSPLKQLQRRRVSLKQQDERKQAESKSPPKIQFEKMLRSWEKKQTKPKKLSKSPQLKK